VCATSLPYSKVIDLKEKNSAAQFGGSRLHRLANMPSERARRAFAHLLWTTLCATIWRHRQLFESKGHFASAQVFSAMLQMESSVHSSQTITRNCG
jgi:hypothetical protein